jgi:hypothetical protein
MSETLIDWLGVIVALVVLGVAVRYLGRFLGWIERSEIARQQAEAAAARNKAAAPADAGYNPEGIPAHHIAVIAAAVAAYGFRVVHIADHATGHAWASEGRWMHQTSHQVPRAH